MQYQSLVNQTTQAQNNLWNHYRDTASWMMQVAENREQRAHDSALAAMQIAGNSNLYKEKFKNNLLLQLGMALG